MPVFSRRFLLAGKTAEERRQRRAGYRLRDFSITSKTRARYEPKRSGDYSPSWKPKRTSTTWMKSFVSGLNCSGPEGNQSMQLQILYLVYISTGPRWGVRYEKPGGFSRHWRRIEAPSRAPPLTVLLAKAIISRAVQKGDLCFACIVALAYHALLRTGEVLALRFCDLEFNLQCGVVSLQQSKSGLRSGSQEAVALRDRCTLQLLDTLWTCQRHFPGQKIWPHSGQAFRKRLLSYFRFFRVVHFGYKGYSLRRGGATFLLQHGVPLEAILLRGHWKSISVGRLYLQDGLAQLPSLRIPPCDLDRINSFAGEVCPTAFHPWNAVRGAVEQATNKGVVLSSMPFGRKERQSQWRSTSPCLSECGRSYVTRHAFWPDVYIFDKSLANAKWLRWPSGLAQNKCELAEPLTVASTVRVK